MCLDRSEVRGPDDEHEPLPGLVLVYSERQPRLSALPLPAGELVLGRGDCHGVTIQDGRVSRRHAAVRLDGDTCMVRDLGSRNGSHADGEPAPPQVWSPVRGLLRLGDSLFLARADVRPYLRAEVVRMPDGRVMGPSSQAVMAQISRAAQFGASLHLAGESGVGKEGAAASFHALGPHARGPFIAVNCAAIPEGIAERLLFGARKGAYSGATGDVDGYVQAAHGGTLFLDEIGDLDLAVQGKLLRVLESREVMPLGATRPRPVELRVCSATHKDLRAQVVAGKLREDLYFRVGRPEVAIPPLRDRPEEIPWLVAAALHKMHAGLWAHPLLVEQCLLRPWPGNIRELLTELTVAARQAAVDDADKVECSHLGPRAGMAFTRAPAPPPAIATPTPTPTPVRFSLPADPRGPEARNVIARALRQAGGNVSETARLLALHRTQLRRLLSHHGLAPDR